tara:strand:+ start:4157 stop:4639 length:483 start_codon:yes stop_codon:yes gene_type:complete
MMKKKKKNMGGVLTAKKAMGPGGKAKKANRQRTRAINKMGKATALYNKGAENKKSTSATAQEFGQGQQARSKGKENRAKNLLAKSRKTATKNNLTFGSNDLYMKAGGSYKKAKMSDVAKYAAGGAKPNSGAVKLAKSIAKKAGMKVVPAAYGKKVIRKKK